MPLDLFHPTIRRWFQSRFESPTEPQTLGWPHLITGQNVLIAAPTGSGKTLTAFLASIDRLFREAESGTLPDEIRVVYVSPLRALSNDMHRNLEVPLAEIQAVAGQMGEAVPPIRVGLRTGDTSSTRRASILKRPPQILVTTPESLYLMLTSPRAREKLATVETVIVDEIHALVRDKRGSHLAITLERLAALCPAPPQRIGLSATQRPMDQIARFLVGYGPDRQAAVAPNGDARATMEPPPAALPVIVDVGHQRTLDLAIEVPPSELGTVCMHEQWAEINARIVELVHSHHATLIFVNTRRLAERLTHQLTELLGEGAISSHHGSLSAEQRHDTESRLKSGELKAVVATASLEMGLDIGYIDLVVQIGSSRNIATFLQRVGRSGHALGLIPKGRLFALTRDELIECQALMRAIRQGRLDVIPIPHAPLDVLAQQIVAEVSTRECGTDELFQLIRRASPYAQMPRADFDAILKLLSEGLTHTAGRGQIYLHHDQVGRRLRARPSARFAAISNAGAIPEVFSIRVVTLEDETVVGSVDEDFGTESQAGDVFLLGNTSWMIRYLRGGDLYVTDAGGAPPTIPFWRGEAPGRTFELSEEVSRLREDLESRLDDPAAAEQWLMEETYSDPFAAHQTVEYARAQLAAIGLLPSQRRVVFERFFDESGGMQMVIHAPFGMRLTRAWGLAMRKRFCRSFDFELQASADDDGIVLSLGPQHSFPLESMFGMLTPRNIQEMFEQAVLAVPIFQNRWRWNATRALQVLRSRNGKKVPPALQRFRSEDLLTAVFPKLTGCQENVVGDIELPDHPLVRQTMDDCLHEAHDIEALRAVLDRIQRGEITLYARDTREPSPFSYELLNSNPYAFLDGGEVAERRARAVATRRSLSIESVQDLGRLDAEAIAQVVAEAQPLVRNADELHDMLLSRILLPENEAAWNDLFQELIASGRATRVILAPQSGPSSVGWAATERIPAVRVMFPDCRCDPDVQVPAEVRHDWDSVEARLTMVRGLMEVCGPQTSRSIAQRLSLTESQSDSLLEALEGEGVVLRGQFTPDRSVDHPGDVEWCHRRLLARIHRLTLDGLRKQIEPVSVDVYWRFLAAHQGVTATCRRAGANGLYEIIGQLQGLDLPAVAWERDLLPARLDPYSPADLDELCLTGELSWGRLFPPARSTEKSRPMASLTRVAPVSLFLRGDVTWLTDRAPRPDADGLSSPAQQVCELLQERGAMFAADLQQLTAMLPSQLEDVLGELVTRGWIASDGFAGLRTLIADKNPRGRQAQLHRGQRQRMTRTALGRWSLRVPYGPPMIPEAAPAPRPVVEDWAWQLLRRWGILFRDVLAREDGAPSWFELLQVLRRLEARGEIRGGRFIVGVGGEQFALPDSVQQLRRLRDEAPSRELLVVCAADPLNLVGVITNHDRIPRTASNRVAYLDGHPVASLVAGEITWIALPPDDLRGVIEQQLRSDGSQDERRARPAVRSSFT